MEFASIFEQLPDMVVTRDARRKIVNVNPAFIHAFGQSPDDWIGKELDGTMSGAQIGAFDENRAYGHIMIDGQKHWIEWIEIKSNTGGSLSVGRINTDRRLRDRSMGSGRPDRRKNMASSHVFQKTPSLTAKTDQPSHAPSARTATQILLAEDDALNAKLAIALLERSGCLVTHVENGKDAVEKAKKHHFDLVFMDIRMPKLNGLKACQAIRELGGSWATIPIVALTANAFAEDKTACHAAGMDGFLTKPISIDALDAARKRWTGQSKNAQTG